MFEDIQKHRQAVRENIEKSFQIGYTESEDFEKAHKVGDIHPNGKLVWTQLPSGKFDWRVIKKTGTPSGGSAPATSQKTAESVLEKLKKEGIRTNSVAYDIIEHILDTNNNGWSSWMERDDSNKIKRPVIIRPVIVQGSGRLRKLVDKREEIKRALKIANIEFEEGNDAPRGGQTGAYIKVKPQANTGGGSGIMGKTVPKKDPAELKTIKINSQQDVKDLIKEIKSKKVTIRIRGNQRRDGSYDIVGRVTGGDYSFWDNGFSVTDGGQLNIKWLGNGELEKRKFYSRQALQRFLESDDVQISYK